MKHTLEPSAEAEFHSAIAYYELCKPGLGERFARAVYSTIALVCDSPKAWHLGELQTRHALVHGFPYAVVYEEEPDNIHIYAVMHLHRRPGYWKDRL